MTDQQLPAPAFGLPTSSTERINAMAHFHRAEMGRLSDWRRRIDQTTNWAITVAAGMVSLSLSTPASHHGVLVFAMVIVLLLLGIEARRYRFFDVYRARIRLLERNYFAEMLQAKADDPDWEQKLAEGLRRPNFLLTAREAFGRRLQRNYIFIFVILLLAWALKISSPRLQYEGLMAEAGSLPEFVKAAAIGPFPGWLVMLAVALFYLSLVVIALTTRVKKGELAHGDAHM
jgi:uncharacterized membrane protein